jgi:lipoprotein-anchoring transpeptidase ErfK/SrfK
MTRGSRTWAAAAIAAGCVFGAVATTRIAARRRPPAEIAPPDPPRTPELALAPPAPTPAPVQPPSPRTAGRRKARRRAGAWTTAAMAAAIILSAVAAVAVASTRPSPVQTVPLQTLSPPVTSDSPQFRPIITAAAPLPHHQTWRWAQVLRPVAARSRPGGKVVARLKTHTPEHTVNIVLVTKTAMHRGRLWVRVRLPVLPNGTQGWIMRSTLSGYTFVDTHLVVSLRHRRLTLWKEGRAIFRAPVGIGAPGTPTPAGQFYIRDRLTGYASPFYGPIAFGTSARSAVLTEWPAGGYIGIHGTNAPKLIPGRPSHGCIRMRDGDLLQLAKLVPIGTPLTIE